MNSSKDYEHLLPLIKCDWDAFSRVLFEIVTTSLLSRSRDNHVNCWVHPFKARNLILSSTCPCSLGVLGGCQVSHLEPLVVLSWWMENVMFNEWVEEQLIFLNPREFSWYIRLNTSSSPSCCQMCRYTITKFGIKLEDISFFYIQLICCG